MIFYLKKIIGNTRKITYNKLTNIQPIVSMNNNPPIPPRNPFPWECCGDDCPNCVWTTYFEEMIKYRKYMKEYEARSAKF